MVYAFFFLLNLLRAIKENMIWVYPEIYKNKIKNLQGKNRRAIQLVITGKWMKKIKNVYVT